MPQIAQIGEIYASQLFWLAIFFGAIFLIVGLGMVPKIQGTVDARDSRIAADLQAAQGARTAADALEEQHRLATERSRAEGARLAAEAKAEAARATEVRVAAADQATGARLEEAHQRIAQARVAAMGEIETVAAEAAGAMVQRVAGLTIDPAAARAAVAQELTHG
jgi:F-type H+-transporting ATPase subunit b